MISYQTFLEYKYVKISVITVCFNSATTIEQTLRSVDSQDYPHKEHIVIDGASSDDTVKIVQTQTRVARWKSEPDQGIYDAMNKGIAMSTGDVIGTLNADDVYEDESILSQVAETFVNPDIDACFADLVYVDAFDLRKVVRYWKSRPYQSGLFERGWMPAHPTFFVRRSVYERFGQFDLSFRRQADFELTMRFLAIYGIKSTYIPKIWVRMRMGGLSNNSLRGVILGNIEAWRACQKHKLSVGPFFVVRKILSRLPQFFYRPI